jgi:hypothetical protein
VAHTSTNTFEQSKVSNGEISSMKTAVFCDVSDMLAASIVGPSSLAFEHDQKGLLFFWQNIYNHKSSLRL